MSIAKEILDYWQSYQHKSGITEPLADAWSFGDNPKMADELVMLVLAGKKTGTATLAIELEKEGEAGKMPQVGDFNVVLDGKGKPAGIIQITSVAVKPFHEVTEAFAISEGEGDRTLGSWKSEHWRCWAKLGQEQGFTMKEDLLVVCQNFKLIHPH